MEELCSSQVIENKFPKKAFFKQTSIIKASGISNDKYCKKINNIYECEFNECNKTFETLKKIKKHIKSHMLKKKIFCDYDGCTKRFTSKNNLKVYF